MSRMRIFEGSPGLADALAGTLEAQGHRPSRSPATAEAAAELPDGVGLVVLALGTAAWSADASAVCRAAGRVGAASLVVAGRDVPVERLAEADDWAAADAPAAEIAVRAARLIARRASSITPPFNGHVLSTIVHDIRTPLSVIGMSRRLIAQSVPQGDPELDEDLRYLDENFRQIELMLAQLSDYYRLYEPVQGDDARPFSPRRLVEEVVEARLDRPWPKPVAVDLDVRGSCPEVVTLGHKRASMAIHYALMNASAAAEGGPVRLVLWGEPGRWITEMAVDRPPPSCVEPLKLAPSLFDRLCGTPTERVGMDLAIASKVSELFGGDARLDVARDSGTVVALDWPVAMAGS